MNIFSLRVILKRIKALRFMLKDKNVKWTKKALIGVCVLYLVLPFDLIPPVIPIVGFIDDYILWALALYHLRAELDKYWLGEKSVDYSKRYKDTVDSECTVEEE